MLESLSVEDLVAVVDVESGRLAAEAERILLTDPVPTCPRWSVQQLVEHVGGVHRWAAAIVGGGLRQSPPEDETAELFAPPSDPGGLLEWFRSGSKQLVETLWTAPDDLQAFVFLKSAPNPRRFWARRQAHETTIHRVDALAARLGRMPSTAETAIPTRVAVDGIDELVTGFVPRRSSRLRTNGPYLMAITPTDADIAWTVAVSSEPPVVRPGADQGAHAVITGTAAALYLGLWNRGNDIAENGTVDALGHWRDQVRVAWS
jgi:uncharacterized protein (TIGR03083 family)